MQSNCTRKLCTNVIIHKTRLMAVLCEMPAIQYSARSAWLYLIRGSVGPPEFLTQTATRSLQPAVFGGFTTVTDRPTDHSTRSVTVGRIHVRCTAMRSNNNCSISRHLDHRFPCFYHQMEQENCRQPTSS